MPGSHERLGAGTRPDPFLYTPPFPASSTDGATTFAPVNTGLSGAHFGQSVFEVSNFSGFGRPDLGGTYSPPAPVFTRRGAEGEEAQIDQALRLMFRRDFGEATPGSLNGISRSETIQTLDRSILAHPGDLDAYGALGDATAPDALVELDRGAAALRLIGAHAGDLSSLPHDVSAVEPAELRAALGFLGSNPALMQAVLRHGVDDVLARMGADVRAGAEAFATFTDGNPAASPEATELARAGSLLIANWATISGSTDPTARLDARALAAVADNDMMPEDLRAAARLWGDAGMIHALDVASEEDLALAERDGRFSADDMRAFLEDGAPRTADDTLALIQRAANLSCVAGVDTSRFRAEHFDNLAAVPNDLKAAVLFDLLDLQGREMAAQAGNIGGGENVLGRIEERIGQLMADPGVQTFLSENATLRTQELVAADPLLREALIARLHGLERGDTLDAWQDNYTDEQRALVNPEVARIAALAREYGTLNLALGTNGQPLVSQDQAAAEIRRLAGAGAGGDFGYEARYASGARLQELVQAGLTPTEALTLFTQEAATLASVQDAATLDRVGPGVEAVTETFILGQGVAAISNPDGSLNEERLRAVLSELPVDPDTGERPDVEQAIKVMRDSWNLVRQSTKVADAFDDLIAGRPYDKLPGVRLYNNGALHGGAAILMGLGLAAMALDGGGISAAEENSFRVMSASMIGASMEAFGKAGTALNGGGTPFLRALETSGKTLGVAAGFVGAILSFQSAHRAYLEGDHLQAGISGLSGTASLVAATAGAVEVGAKIGLVTAAVGTTAAAVAGVAACVGIVIVLGGMAIIAYRDECERRERDEDYRMEVADEYRRYGLVG